MLSLKSTVLLNVKSLSALSPGGIDLGWLTHLVNSSCTASQEQVKEAAKELVKEKRLQEPFANIFLLIGAEVLIARG